jgi:2,4-didehydro-3-deoxy-L-rhamnonate hydrolase
MRFVRIGESGLECPGVLVTDDSFRDLSPLTPDIDHSFVAALADGSVHAADIDALAVQPVDGQRFGPPIVRPGKIICIGLNFADHAAESGMPAPSEPVVFFKAPNTLVGPNDDVRIPRESNKTDWEVELGVVIGRECRYLESPADAERNIAGYCISNDVSEREFQLERGGQWVKGKSCETFNPCGPWLVTPEDVMSDRLGMWLDVNGIAMQRGSTATMIFNVARVVWYLSQFMVLEPGDLINTGTPPGVGMGRKPQQFLQPGDVVELGIDGLGTQRQHLIAAP